LLSGGVHLYSHYLQMPQKYTPVLPTWAMPFT